jgi:hypothetical protein
MIEEIGENNLQLEIVEVIKKLVSKWDALVIMLFRIQGFVRSLTSVLFALILRSFWRYKPSNF